MDIIRQRIRNALLPDAPGTLESMAQDAAHYRDSLGADGSWPDIDYRDQTPGPWKTSRHLERLLKMAQVYCAPGPALAGQAALKVKLLAGLDYWLQNDFRNPNWWHNEIGVPGLLGKTMLLMGDETTPSQREKAIAILQRSHLANTDGANLTWMARNQILRGCLANSPAVVAEAFDALWQEIHIARPGKDGIQPDYSFHQHGPVLYNGGYGASFMETCLQFIEDAHGTRFAIPVERLRIFENYVLDGQQWMVRNAHWDYGALGRDITRASPGADGTSYILGHVAEVLAQNPGPRQQELRDCASRLHPGLASVPLTGNRYFWQSDFMAQQRLGYFTSARMFSTRTFNTDGYINNEGKRSQHLADGATYIFRRGDEYRNIFPVWDWLRVPGTTVEQNPAPLDPAQVRIKGATSFVGGVSDGTYGAAAMDLVRDQLSARKAWFYFDDEWVCLGAGITCPTENPVFTAVNQCLLNGDVRVQGQPAALDKGDHALTTLTDSRWVLHDGIGYIFPAGTPLHLANQARSGKWSDIGAGSSEMVSSDVFSLSIDHGPHPTGATYQYMVVPNTDAPALAVRTAIGGRPVIETLSNTPEIQAVRHKGLQIEEAVFRGARRLDAGPGWNLGVDQPCLMLVRVLSGGVEVAVANPENQPLAVNVVINRSLDGEGCTPGPNETTIHFDLPGGPEAGRSVVRMLKQK